MKWLIRIACFVITTAIYIPIETALHNSGVNKPFIWITTIAIYFFIFYIPSNAVIAMYKKSKDERLQNSQESSLANAQGPNKIEKDPFKKHQRIYNMRGSDGSMIRVEEEFLPNFYSVQYGQDFVSKIQELNRVLEDLSADYVRATHGKLIFRQIIFYWWVYCKAVLPSIENKAAEGLLICLFKKSICGSSDLFEHIPPAMADWLLTFFSKTRDAINWNCSEVTPLDEDGATKFYSLRPMDKVAATDPMQEVFLPSESKEDIDGIIIYAHRAVAEAERIFRETNLT